MNEIAEVNSLRWLANNFPWTDSPRDETDRLSNAIHLYCSAGADMIEKLSAITENEKKRITLIEFINEYANLKNANTKVVLECFGVDDGIDEEYCFEGLPSEFIEKYTKDYDCIDGYDIFDVHELKIVNDGIRSLIYIGIVSE